MTDIHSHIMFNVDDGSNCLEESLELLKKLREVGFNNVILTPHYIRGNTYNVSNDIKLEKFNILKEEVVKNSIDINLYLGNEVFISNYMVEDIKADNIYTLNNGKYLLFELPFNNKIINLLDVIYEITLEGYIPILAHPERYSYFQKNYKLVDELKSEGLLFQANYGSILGYYGKEAKKLLNYMLKKNYIDYFGTDIHRINHSFVLDNFNKIEKHIKRIIGDEYYSVIMDNCDNLVKSRGK